METGHIRLTATEVNVIKEGFENLTGIAPTYLQLLKMVKRLARRKQQLSSPRIWFASENKGQLLLEDIVAGVDMHTGRVRELITFQEYALNTELHAWLAQ